MGRIEQNIARQAKRNRQNIPDEILNAPRLKPGLDLFLSAFYALEKDRGAHGYIPWSILRAYADAADMAADQFADLQYFCDQICEALIAKSKEIAPAAAPAKGSENGVTVRPSKSNAKARR